MNRQKIIEIKAKYRPVVTDPPQCCAACEYLTDSARCSRYNEDVPEDYIETLNDCPAYCQRVPF